MRPLVAFVLLAPFLSGCVERLLAVRSDPPGAMVFLDDEKVGETPCEVKYVWYGTRDLALELKGYRAVREKIALDPPWWQIFPLDFITDVLVPFTLTDRLERSFALEKAAITKGEVDEVIRRADELRKKLEPPR